MVLSPSKIIDERVEDIETLLKIMDKETDKNMKLIWRYHLRLNEEIIRATFNRNYVMVVTLLHEMDRSMAAAKRYIIFDGETT